MGIVYVLALTASLANTAVMLHFVWKTSAGHAYALAGLMAIQFMTGVLVELAKR